MAGTDMWLVPIRPMLSVMLILPRANSQAVAVLESFQQKLLITLLITRLAVGQSSHPSVRQRIAQKSGEITFAITISFAQV
ncbi:MAG: hypothetical protein ACREP3_03370 [Candidatus Binatia bacterium]